MPHAVVSAAGAVLFIAMALAPLGAQDAGVLLEVGRDFPETRLFDACQVRLAPSANPLLAVAGFSQTGQGDVADLSVYEWSESEKPILLWRLLRGGGGASSIRTLRAADLDRDGRDELIGLGRIGDEEKDSQGELQIFRHDGAQWKPLTGERWQSGQYTHGYGMDIADLNGDGRLEIVTGGFFARGQREQAELRVCKLDGQRLSLIAGAQWGSDQGHTRINSVRIGDLDGDGAPEIVSAGRTGQVKAGEHVTTQEADQLVAWQLAGQQLIRKFSYESKPEEKGRFRELRLANLDGAPGLELLAVGRHEPLTASRPGGGGGSGPGTGGGKGTGGGGGKGTGGGGGRGTGGETGADRAPAEESQPLRPLFAVFKLQEGPLKRVSTADFAGSLGEVRDVVTVRNDAGKIQVITITANELKPDRSARLDIWELNGLSLHSKSTRVVDLGDETRARQIVLWGPSGQRRILTVGFVHRANQILGQLLDWGPL